MTTPARLTPAMRRYLTAYAVEYADAQKILGYDDDRAALHASGAAIRTAVASNRGGARTDLLNRLRQAGLIEKRHLGDRRISATYSAPMYGYVLTDAGRTALEQAGR